MACTWRIRHKLMLGMLLVLLIMALLLGGTLHGLASYRSVMATCERKLDELEIATQLRDAVKAMKLPTPNEAEQRRVLIGRKDPIFSSLQQYKVKLNDTVDSGRAPDKGAKEYGLVSAIESDLADLDLKLNSLRPGVNASNDPI